MTDFPLVQLSQIELNNPNPSMFEAPFAWKIRFDVFDNVPETVNIRFTYVGSAESSDFDQMLDEFDVGPFPLGPSEFILECDGPQAADIPEHCLTGITVLQVRFSYKNQVFLTVGYYVQVAYFDDNLNLNPPMKVDLQMLGKNVIMNKPLINSIPITWYDTPATPSNNEGYY